MEGAWPAIKAIQTKIIGEHLTQSGRKATFSVIEDRDRNWWRVNPVFGGNRLASSSFRPASVNPFHFVTSRDETGRDCHGVGPSV